MKTITLALLLLPGYALADYTMPIATFTIGFGDGKKIEASSLALLGYKADLRANAADDDAPKKNNTALWVGVAVVATVAIVLAVRSDDSPPQPECETTRLDDVGPVVAVGLFPSNTVTPCN